MTIIDEKMGHYLAWRKLGIYKGHAEGSSGELAALWWEAYATGLEEYIRCYRPFTTDDIKELITDVLPDQIRKAIDDE